MFYSVILKLAHFVCLILFRLRFEGLENIPKEEGYIVSSNHRTYFDPVFLALKNPKHMNFMAKEELFQNKLFGWLISKLGAFPVVRGAGDTSTLDRSVEILQSGEPLLIFPEGTRSPNGIPGRPRTGAALISARAGVGVLPVSIDYGDKLSFRTTVTLRYHPLLSAEELGVDETKPSTMRTASRMIMDSIVSGLTQIPQKEETKA